MPEERRYYSSLDSSGETLLSVLTLKVWRYCLGVMPYSLLKAAERCPALEKPRVAASAEMDWEVVSR